MDRVFNLYLAKADQPESGAYAELSLPATPYQIQDAFDKLRLAEGESPYWEITEYHQFEDLYDVLDNTCELYELNALAHRLSDLYGPQRTAFEGLLKMEQEGENTIPISRLIDLAYSTDCCHVAESVVLDEQLGEFLVENDLVPGLEDMSEKLYRLLDLEQIGKEHRQTGGGVFVASGVSALGGYVELESEVMELYETLDLTPKAPDYAILLEVSKGFFNDPGYDSEKTVQLKLPASPEALSSALEAVEAWDWRETGWSCLDCRVPALTELISDTEEGIDSLNDLAQRLADMEPNTLIAYKALLEATDCKDLQSAETLMDSLDNYIVSPRYSSPSEVAKGKLTVILCESDAALLAPHLNLYQYGQALIEACGGILTDYGLIERKDSQPVQTMKDGPNQGGMELTW